MGFVVDTKRTRPEDKIPPVDVVQAMTHMAYANQQRLDGYNEAVQHAFKRKNAFDKRVLQKYPGEVVFEPGQLIQVYRSDTDYNFRTERKLIPKWSQPRRVAERIQNSYKLVTLEGTVLPGEYSARRLRAFVPRPGTKLYEDQEQYMQRTQREQREVTEEVERQADDERKEGSGSAEEEDQHTGSEQRDAERVAM